MVVPWYIKKPSDFNKKTVLNVALLLVISNNVRK